MTVLRKAPNRRVPIAFFDSNEESALTRLRDPENVAVLFGAGHVGGEFLKAAKKYDIRVAAFCDNSDEKQFHHGLPVIKPEDAAKKYPDANFVICFIDVPAAATQLHSLGVSHAYGVGLLRREPAPESEPGFSDAIRLQQAVHRCVGCHTGFAAYPEKISSGYEVEIDITSRCTLRCENCGNFMQYYQNPRHRDTEELLRGIDSLCECFDDIVTINVIGGEPMLHPDFHRIAAYAAGKENVSHVGIITNGTLFPNPEQWRLLAHPKIAIKISDYGPLSRNRDRLVEEAPKYGIRGYVLNIPDWKELRLMSKRGLNEDALRKLFRDCGEGISCLTFMDRRLFRCEQAANGVNLGAMPNDPANCVDLGPVIDGEKDAREEVRRCLGYFVYENDMTPACDYCLGLCKYNKRTPKAVQCAFIQELPA